MRLSLKVGGVLLGVSAATLGLASFASIRVLGQSQEAGLRDQVDRSLRVGLALTLRHVQAVATEVVRLAESVDVQSALATSHGYLPRGLVEVSDTGGHVTWRKPIGDVAETVLSSADDSPLARRGLGYERQATLHPTPTGIVLRAVAPILDGSFALRGAVVLSAPLDDGFAELLKGAVDAQVGFYVGARPAASTFSNPDGRRLVGFELPRGLERTLEDGRMRRGRTDFVGRSFEVGVAPLQSIEGARIGLLAVAVDRQSIMEARHSALRTLFFGSVIASGFALVLAVAFARALTRPIRRLQQAARAISRGDLGERIPQLGRDELGELAASFEGMTVSLREQMAREVQFREELEDTVRRRTGELQTSKEELELANAKLAELAITDGLTGISNHRYFQERLALEVERSGRSGLPVSLLMIDADHFKRYNDNCGHPAGDEVLRTLAQVLSEGRRRTDVVARYGGEEFALLLPDAGQEFAAKLAERLRLRVESCVPITVSIGLASYPADAGNAEALVRAADAALYQAKRAGRNRVVRCGGEGTS